MRKIIIGITGASGVIYGIRLLEVLQDTAEVETHLVMSNSGRMNIAIETDFSVNDVEALADIVHKFSNIGAVIASGSFKTDGMIVAPCSMKTLSNISHSMTDNLLTRAADVVLKEGRKLVLMPREVPLHVGHCKLLHKAAKMGAVISPPMPAFYNHPQTIDDIINHSVGRVLDLFNIEVGLIDRWKGVAN